MIDYEGLLGRYIAWIRVYNGYDLIGAANQYSRERFSDPEIEALNKISEDSKDAKGILVCDCWGIADIDPSYSHAMYSECPACGAEMNRGIELTADYTCGPTTTIYVEECRNRCGIRIIHRGHRGSEDRRQDPDSPWYSEWKSPEIGS